MREKVVCVQAVVSICSICANLALLVSNIEKYRAADDQDYMRYCHCELSYYLTDKCSRATNLVTLWLSIYMSLEFIKPVTREWRTVHQGDGTDEIARRYNQAAQEEANQYIKYY